MYVPQLPSLLYSKPVHPSRCLHVCAQFSIPFPGLDQDFPFPSKFNDMCLKPQPHLTSQEESNESIHILVNQCLLRPCIIGCTIYILPEKNELPLATRQGSPLAKSLHQGLCPNSEQPSGHLCPDLSVSDFRHTSPWSS